jgi:hypothetical protein
VESPGRRERAHDQSLEHDLAAKVVSAFADHALVKRRAQLPLKIHSLALPKLTRHNPLNPELHFTALVKRGLFQRTDDSDSLTLLEVSMQRSERPARLCRLLHQPW